MIDDREDRASVFNMKELVLTLQPYEQIILGMVVLCILINYIADRLEMRTLRLRVGLLESKVSRLNG